MSPTFCCSTARIPATGRSARAAALHDWSLSRRIIEDVGIPAILAGGSTPKMSRRRLPQFASRRRFEDQDRSREWAWQRPRKGEALRRSRETHQVKAVARSSTAPLFWMTPNSCNRHCDRGAQPRVCRSLLWPRIADRK